MMDCQHVKQLLSLWIGQDLPDAATANDVCKHREQGREWERREISLQASLEVRQGWAAILVAEAPHRSVWHSLANRISDWDGLRHRERFNGWVPASVMTLAVVLMVAVSI